jgi:delta 1-pyrroline-5-carboxylate dehydrogenase
MDAIEANGYGLTLGIHSRIETTQRHITERLRIGNSYVNRNQIGAVVGVQPFGGRGLSGTGPKAGGPITLYRFAEERVMSVNTAAAGGNAALLASDDDRQPTRLEGGTVSAVPGERRRRGRGTDGDRVRLGSGKAGARPVRPR